MKINKLVSCSFLFFAQHLPALKLLHLREHYSHSAEILSCRTDEDAEGEELFLSPEKTCEVVGLCHLFVDLLLRI